MKRSGGTLTVKGSIKVMGDAYLGDTIHGNNNLNDPDRYGSLVLKSKDPSIYIHGNANIKNFHFAGQMYVNNHVDINGDFNTNGTVYVSNDASVENFSNHDGTLVLMADGNIQIANNNLYNDEPKILRAYFYSNKELEIYGVGSNLKIMGGIYGQSIILNASKGKTKEAHLTGCEKGFEKHVDLCFEKNQAQLPPEKSRLSIHYDERMILNPPIGIPTTDRFIIKSLDTTYENKTSP